MKHINVQFVMTLWQKLSFNCFNCFTCSLPMHPCCIDPDMPDDVIAYLCAGNAPGNFACYCHKCNRHPNNSMTHSSVSSVSNEGLLQLEKRLTSIENLLNRDRISQPTVPSTHEPTNKTKPGNDSSTPTRSSYYIASIQEEISEALEKGRRKNNLIIFSMSNQAEADDHNRLSGLFEHITGKPAGFFRCERIGKQNPGKVNPVLVKFFREEDRHDILRNSRKLRDMQAE